MWNIVDNWFIESADEEALNDAEKKSLADNQKKEIDALNQINFIIDKVMYEKIYKARPSKQT